MSSRILQISTVDRGAGCAKVVLNLHKSYIARGHDARLLVGFQCTNTVNVAEAGAYSHTSIWAPLCAYLDRLVANGPSFRGKHRLRDWLRCLAWPRRLYDRLRGAEDFNYPYSHHLLDDPAWVPDIIHMHNLHGNYFDLSALVPLSQQVPVVLTLHDAWLLTGHCAYPIDCERWRTGCSECPDLKRPPTISRDRTHENWLRKKAIYDQSRLFVATNSCWLMNMVDQSMLAAVAKRVIPNGTDLRVFHPSDQKGARSRLKLPQDAFICLFVARTGSKSNPYKDYTTVQDAVEQIQVVALDKRLLFVCVGGRAMSSNSPNRRFVGFVSEPERMASYYQAADILLHAANAESFGLVLIEAQACGLPVVATAVGGIPETLRDQTTGFLVPRGDSKRMSQRVLEMIQKPELHLSMKHAAARWAFEHFDLDQQTESYLGWYHELKSKYGFASDAGCA